MPKTGAPCNEVAAYVGMPVISWPDNDAWAKVPSDKMQRLETSEESLTMLFNFHLLNKGSYPRSTTGMGFRVDTSAGGRPIKITRVSCVRWEHRHKVNVLRSLLSCPGMFYSPQFFPTTSAEPSVIYAQVPSL